MRKYVFNPINNKFPSGAVVKGTTVTYNLQVSKFEKPTKAFFVVHQDGEQPEYIEMMDKIANGESSTILPTILADFRAHDVKQYVNTKVSAIEAGCVKAAQGEEEIAIPCDMVVMAVGSKKNFFDVEGITVPVYYAGDCSGDRTASIAEAVRGGYKAANEI